ncbi:MAG: Holliday junction branch migration DNA helicase RuvB [Patescibacteria group bacterium]
MNEEKNKKTTPEQIEDDKTLDLALRPKRWGEYIGQEKVKRNVQIIIEAAEKRGEKAPEHMLFHGNSGLGKTTLAYLIAKEMGAGIRVTSGPAIKKTGELAAILTNLSEGDILFIDEIHRLNKVCEEMIYPVLEEFNLNLVVGNGPMARTVDLNIPQFTLIGATTQLALLSGPLRNRFGATFRLEPYSKEEIKKIIQRSANLLGVSIEGNSIEKIASRSRFTPRVANRLLKRVRDFAEVEEDGIITPKITEKTFKNLNIDEKGLESGDINILETLIDKFDGGPAGIKAIAAAANERKDTILEIYEPYLVQIDFIKRTSRGRIATEKAYKHLGKEIN